MTPAERVQAARADIARRRALACLAPTQSWRSWNDGHVGDDRLGGLLMPTVGNRDEANGRRATSAHVAANDPAHVLAVLAKDEGVLDRHAQESPIGLAYGDWCPAEGDDYPCNDLLAVLSVYAPEETP